MLISLAALPPTSALRTVRFATVSLMRHPVAPPSEQSLFARPAVPKGSVVWMEELPDDVMVVSRAGPAQRSDRLSAPHA